MRSFVFCLLAILLLINCASNSKVTEEEKNVKYFSSFEFDQYGIPSLSNEIEFSKLSGASDYFLARYIDAGPESIYIVKRVKSKKNLLSPFKVIYEWTGKGFKYGYATSKEIIEKSGEIAGSTVRTPLFILSAVPGYIIGTTIFVASGATGFIIGLKESGPEAYNSIKKMGRTDGLILGKYMLQYDRQNRIKKLIHHSSPPDNEILSETEYYYRKNSISPYRSINYSYVDKKKRVIYEQ